MKGPLADKRPLGPFALRAGSECVLRYHAVFNFRELPSEVDESLKRGIQNEISRSRIGEAQSLNVSNISITRSSQQIMEIAMDLSVKQTSQVVEDEINSSIAVVLGQTDAVEPDLEEWYYSVVAR